MAENRNKKKNTKLANRDIRLSWLMLLKSLFSSKSKFFVIVLSLVFTSVFSLFASVLPTALNDFRTGIETQYKPYNSYATYAVNSATADDYNTLSFSKGLDTENKYWPNSDANSQEFYDDVPTNYLATFRPESIQSTDLLAESSYLTPVVRIEPKDLDDAYGIAWDPNLREELLIKEEAIAKRVGDIFNWFLGWATAQPIKNWIMAPSYFEYLNFFDNWLYAELFRYRDYEFPCEDTSYTHANNWTCKKTVDKKVTFKNANPFVDAINSGITLTTLVGSLLVGQLVKSPVAKDYFSIYVDENLNPIAKSLAAIEKYDVSDPNSEKAPFWQDKYANKYYANEDTKELLIGKKGSFGSFIAALLNFFSPASVQEAVKADLEKVGEQFSGVNYRPNDSKSWANLGYRIGLEIVINPESQYFFSFGTVPYDATTDALFTNVDGTLVNGSQTGQEISIWGITRDNELLSNADKAVFDNEDAFVTPTNDYLTALTKLPGPWNGESIPVYVNDSFVKKYPDLYDEGNFKMNVKTNLSLSNKIFKTQPVNIRIVGKKSGYGDARMYTSRQIANALLSTNWWGEDGKIKMEKIDGSGLTDATGDLIKQYSIFTVQPEIRKHSPSYNDGHGYFNGKMSKGGYLADFAGLSLTMDDYSLTKLNPRGAWKALYQSDQVNAILEQSMFIVILMVWVILVVIMLISLVVFIIAGRFIIDDNRRGIAVMKCLGYKKSQILFRTLCGFFILGFLILAVAIPVTYFATAGGLTSFLQSILGSQSVVVIQLTAGQVMISIALMVAFFLLVSYVAMRGIKKISPSDSLKRD